MIRGTALALLAFGMGCKDQGTDPRPIVALRAEQGAVRIGEPAFFVRSGGGLRERSYSGSIGAAASTFGVVDDSTLVAVVPGSLAAGTAQVSVDLGDADGKASIELLPGVQIAKPAAVVQTVLNHAVSSIRLPKPAHYHGNGWSADSALVERLVAEGRAAFAQMSPAEQLEMARLVQSVNPGAAFPVGGQASRARGSLVTAGTTNDAQCAQQLTSLEGSTKGAEDAARAAATFWGSPLKWAVMRVFVVKDFIQAVLTNGEVGIICTMEQHFTAEGAPTGDRLGTAVDVSADHRTFIDADEIANAIAKRRSIVKKNLTNLYKSVVSLFSEGESKPSAPVSEPQGVVVRKNVPVEPARITLETTSVTTSDGRSVPIRVVRRDGKVVVEAMGEFRSREARNLTFKISRPGYETKTLTAPVQIQPVCWDAGKWKPGCVEKIVLSPASQTVQVGADVSVKATLYDYEGRVITPVDPIRWSSSNESVLSAGYFGAYKAVAPGSATVTAAFGSGDGERRGTASVTVAQRGDPPVITGVTLSCTANGQYHRMEVSFVVTNGPPFVPGGTYSGAPYPGRYPVRLEFLQKGTQSGDVWSNASNGYTARLLSGDGHNGVAEVTMSSNGYSYGAACQQDGTYTKPNRWFDGWRIYLIDRYGQESNKTTFDLYTYTRGG